MKAIRIASILLFAAATNLQAQPPDMASYWPSADGLAWEYEIVAEGMDASTAVGRLRFDGTETVPGGAVARTLIEELVATGPLKAAPGSVTDPLLRNIWMARPDLREAIELRSSGSAAPAQAGWEPLLLHGGAFDIDNDKIFTWQRTPEFTSGPNWIFLVSDLAIGNTFQLQLVPDLAPDVFLYGAIAALEEVSCPAGVYTNALRVDYRVDYGESLCTSESSPDPTGTFRSETRGSNYYAAGIGPVRSVEEFVFTEVTGDCDLPPGAEIGVPIQTFTLCLIEGPVGVEAVSWGRVKGRFGGD